MTERKNDSMFFGIATNSDVIIELKKLKENMVRGCNDISVTIVIIRTIIGYMLYKTDNNNVFTTLKPISLLHNFP